MSGKYPDPSLENLLEEPITRMVMERDGVTEQAIRQLLSDVGERISAGRDDMMRLAIDDSSGTDRDTD